MKMLKNISFTVGLLIAFVLSLGHSTLLNQVNKVRDTVTESGSNEGTGF